MWAHKPTLYLFKRHDSAFQGVSYQGFPGTDSSELSVTLVVFVHCNVSDSYASFIWVHRTRIQECKFYSWSLAFHPITIFPCSLALNPRPYALDLDYLLSKTTEF